MVVAEKESDKAFAASGNVMDLGRAITPAGFANAFFRANK